MLYTTNNPTFTKLYSFFVALQLLDCIQILQSNAHSITIQLKSTKIDFSLLKKQLEALLECELILMQSATDICSFGISNE